MDSIGSMLCESTSLSTPFPWAFWRPWSPVSECFCSFNKDPLPSAPLRCREGFKGGEALNGVVLLLRKRWSYAFSRNIPFLPQGGLLGFVKTLPLVPAKIKPIEINLNLPVARPSASFFDAASHTDISQIQPLRTPHPNLFSRPPPSRLPLLVHAMKFLALNCQSELLFFFSS